MISVNEPNQNTEKSLGVQPYVKISEINIHRVESRPNDVLLELCGELVDRYNPHNHHRVLYRSDRHSLASALKRLLHQVDQPVEEKILSTLQKIENHLSHLEKS